MATAEANESGGKRDRAEFGSIRQLPAKDSEGRKKPGRWQARWKSKDGYFAAPHTFPNNSGDRNPYDPKKASGAKAARRWLDDHRREIETGDWQPNKKRMPHPAEADGPRTFEVAAQEWLSRHERSPRTDDHYRQLLVRHLYPTFGHRLVTDVTRHDVDDWWRTFKVGAVAGNRGQSGDTAKRHAYSVMKSIFTSEESRHKVPHTPCRLDKGDLRRRSPGTQKRTVEVLDSAADLAELVAVMPERHRALVELTTWCALRYGEVTALRRPNINLDAGELHVINAVTRVTGREPIEKEPKGSKAGVRTLPIPEHLIDRLRDHLAEWSEPARDGLVFPAAGGGFLPPASFYGRAPVPATRTRAGRPGSGFYGARAAIGRDGLHFHDLRHTGLTWLAQAGATDGDLMIYGGHSTLAMVAKYTGHKTAGRLRSAQDAMVRAQQARQPQS